MVQVQETKRDWASDGARQWAVQHARVSEGGGRGPEGTAARGQAVGRSFQGRGDTGENSSGGWARFDLSPRESGHEGAPDPGWGGWMALPQVRARAAVVLAPGHVEWTCR